MNLLTGASLLAMAKSIYYLMNKQQFFIGFESRAEIDRYEIRHAKKLNLTRV